MHSQTDVSPLTISHHSLATSHDVKSRPTLERKDRSQDARHEPASTGEQAIALTIAGFDPSSGAGLTADLKVFAAHGHYGVAAPTALTVQSTAGVLRVEAVSAALLAEMLACLAEDLPLAGIKIGMLANAANVAVVATFLEDLLARSGARSLPVVLDPVLCSSSGHPLLDRAGLELLRSRVLPLVSCATPNLDELLLLGERPPKSSIEALQQTEQAVEAEAGSLAQQFPTLGIIVTGGHRAQPHDLILAPGVQPCWVRGEWIDTPATHGTGCGYSSALLCALMSGRNLTEAGRAAKHYVSEALRAAIPMGRGGGSMHHLHAFSPRSISVSKVRISPDDEAGGRV